jgi:hypothetical protein
MSQGNPESVRKTTTPAPRRAAQACSICRHRKTRCDAGFPKCGLCTDLGVDCVYFDSPVIKIDPSTRLLLDRIQQLEDRIVSSPLFAQSIQSPNGTACQPSTPKDALPLSGNQPSVTESLPERSGVSRDGDSNGLTLPAIHDANANHVYQWPILGKILNYGWPRESISAPFSEATDVFLQQMPQHAAVLPVHSWRLLENLNDTALPHHWAPVNNSSRPVELQVRIYKDLIEEFFLQIHVFYPMFHRDDIFQLLQDVLDSHISRNPALKTISSPQYCLLVLILCLGALAKWGTTVIEERGWKAQTESSPEQGNLNSPRGQTEDFVDHSALEGQLWEKTRLLLGSVALENTEEAATCFALARYKLRDLQCQRFRSYRFFLAANMNTMKADPHLKQYLPWCKRQCARST